MAVTPSPRAGRLPSSRPATGSCACRSASAAPTGDAGAGLAAEAAPRPGCTASRCRASACPRASSSVRSPGDRSVSPCPPASPRSASASRTSWDGSVRERGTSAIRRSVKGSSDLGLWTACPGAGYVPASWSGGARGGQRSEGPETGSAGRSCLRSARAPAGLAGGCAAAIGVGRQGRARGTGGSGSDAPGSGSQPSGESDLRASR